MRDREKTKEQLISELEELRKRNGERAATKARHQAMILEYVSDAVIATDAGKHRLLKSEIDGFDADQGFGGGTASWEARIRQERRHSISDKIQESSSKTKVVEMSRIKVLIVAD